MMKLKLNINKFPNFRALVLFLFSLVAIQAQVALPGECPSDIQVVSDFNVAEYLGTWYEYAKYPAIFEGNGKCIVAEYSLNDDGTVKVVNTQVDPVTGEKSGIVGTATVVNDGKLSVQFPGAPTPMGSNYWVLDTDYTEYSVVYSCSNAKSVHLIMV